MADAVELIARQVRLNRNRYADVHDLAHRDWNAVDGHRYRTRCGQTLTGVNGAMLTSHDPTCVACSRIHTGRFDRLTINHSYHTVRTPRTENTMTETVAKAICQVLHTVEHIPVTAEVDVLDGAVHIIPSRKVSTPEEVTVLRAFAAVSTSRLIWEGAR